MTHRSSIFVVALTMLFAAIIAKVHAVYNKHVPEGYQDEEGFHFGDPPKDSDKYL